MAQDSGVGWVQRQGDRRSVLDSDLCMDIKQLRYFTAIVDAGSMSSAAARIGIAQPSLTQHIKTLEGRLGVDLLVRSSKGVTVTAAGEILLSHARSILAVVKAAKEEVRMAGTEPYGKVRCDRRHTAERAHAWPRGNVLNDTSNTNAPSMMIGGKCADMMLSQA